MSLNTNFSNPNNRSAVSFQAAFKADIPVKDIERLANIKKLFSKATEHYNSDTLTYTMSKDSTFAGYPVLTTTPDRLSCGEFEYSHLIDNLDKLIQNMSDKQIVKKLVAYFKTMKKEEQFENYMNDISKSIAEVRLAKDKNLRSAEFCSNAGSNKLSAQFRTLAENNQGKIDKLEAQKLKRSKQLVDEMEKAVNNEVDLSELPRVYREFYCE